MYLPVHGGSQDNVSGMTTFHLVSPAITLTGSLEAWTVLIIPHLTKQDINMNEG